MVRVPLAPAICVLALVAACVSPEELRRQDEAEWLDGDLRDVGRPGAMLQAYPAEAMAAALATPSDRRVHCVENRRNLNHLVVPP